MDFERYCEEQLILHNIPYKRNVIIYNGDRSSALVELDFIIPGAIIETKAGEIRHTGLVRKVIEQLKRQLEYTPANFKVYFYSQPLLPKVMRCLMFDPRITLITSIDQIELPTFKYFTNDAATLRTLASEDNPYYQLQLLRYPLIYTPKEMYLRAIAMMNEKEMQRIIQFNFHFVDLLKPHYIQFKNANDAVFKGIKKIVFQSEGYQNIFQKFHEKIYFYPLKSHDPIILIDGISGDCKMCHCFKYCENVVGDRCYRCASVKKRKYNETDFYIKPKHKKYVRFELE